MSLENRDRSLIDNRDYTLVIDASGTMATPDQPGDRTRWEAIQESTLALTRKCEELDSDGLTVYLFSDSFRRYDQVISSQVSQLFETNTPVGSTNLVPVLQHAVNNYFQRKAAGQTKAAGETILVVTDGEPNDRLGVANVIIDTSHRMDRDEELAILFVQVGSDEDAKRFLKSLDEQLQGVGAKFDICDTVTLEEMEDMTLTDVLLNAIID